MSRFIFLKDPDGKDIPAAGDADGNTKVNIQNTDLEIVLPTPLKGDELTGIGIDDANVAQTGILKANLFNPGNTTIYVWFGEAPDTGKKIPIRPGGSWNEAVDNKSTMHYKSSAAGGQLDYVLLG